MPGKRWQMRLFCPARCNEMSQAMIGTNENEVPNLMTAAELARRLGVARSYVYEHAGRLGAVRLGDGKRPRLRFDPRVARQALPADTADSVVLEAKASRRRQGTSMASTSSYAGVKLLPINGARLR